MAVSGVAAARCLLTALVLLPHGSIAATLHSETESSMLRKELPRKSIQLSASGEMIQASRTSSASEGDSSPNPTMVVKIKSKINPDSDDIYNLADLKTEFCDYDFPLGKEGTNNCTDNDKHELILQESMCIDAASESGATTSHDSFREPAEWENKHPKGCFKYSCSEASNNICYFYNGDGDWPHPLPVKGTPVCSRRRHLNGTVNSAAEDGGCPSGYSLVDHEDTCRQVANCLGYCAGAEFRIGQHNASKHLEYPQGCFVHATDGCVYYNAGSKMGTGTNVAGTPLCNVSKVTSWPA